MKRILCCLLCAALIWLCGCSAPDAPADVAATTLPVFQFSQILCQGTGLNVKRIINESVSCLHDYSLNVTQVKALESAQVVVISGAGLEDFMKDLLDGKPVIDSSVGIPLLESCHDPEHQHHDGHHHENDSHIWLSPRNAMQMAANICDGLCLQFPQHESTIRANLPGLLEQLQTLTQYGDQNLKDLSCRNLVTFHDGFSYFADCFDLTILAAVEEESGSEASAQDLIELIQIVNTHRLPAVFVEENGADAGAKVIAAETGCSLFRLHMAMAGDDYFAAMYQNIDAIKEALG